MYKKLSGMTGTAKTEATEFTEIYGLNIVTVPTNRPVIRKDYPDAIYKTINGKYNAVIKQVMECHKNGQPVLVGTVSVEKSETLAKMLQKYTRDFNVLNAKNHEREAEIVAQAGKKGAITIATNMAGRGTDIMLGGNAEYMAKAQMRKEHFCEKLLNPEKPEEALPAAVELLLIEADGHGETADANILAVRKRFDDLYAQGYRGLLFDIDNTLVPHGAPADERACALFAHLKELGFKCCFLSNNQYERVSSFNDAIGAQFIENAHKPSTKNYIRAMELLGTDRSNTVFIGDQLFTDIYGCLLYTSPSPRD